MAIIQQRITLTQKGLDSGPDYEVYYSLDCITYIPAGVITLPNLGSVGLVEIDENSECIKLVNNNFVCTNEMIKYVGGIPEPTTTTTTTLEPTTTTTTSEAPVTTTTTSEAPVITYYIVDGCNPGDPTYSTTIEPAAINQIYILPGDPVTYYIWNGVTSVDGDIYNPSLQIVVGDFDCPV